MSSAARANPEKLFIGIDANAKALEKLSIKATRKPAKGGLPNAIFVQAAVDDLPCEFAGIASEIYINFPWGSLLRAVAAGDRRVLNSLNDIFEPAGMLTVTIGIDHTRDRAELDRLGISFLDLDYLNSTLAKRYREAGFRMVECHELSVSEWRRIETSWARKLGGNDRRRVHRLKFVRAG